MPPPDRRLFRDIAWLIVLILLSSAWCLTAAQRLGATFDEPVYLRTGLDGWRTGSHRGLLRMGTMPLPADVQTLPLYLIERMTGQPWNLDSDFACALLIARGMTLLFWWLLLLYVWRAGRMIAGPMAGILAATIVAVEPNLLAHASLATTDIAVTACLLAFIVHYRLGRDSHSVWQRTIVPGLWCGIALTAKASALVFAPICVAAVEFERFLSTRPANAPLEISVRQSLARIIGDVLRIGSIGMAIVFIFCGCDWRPDPSFVAWSRQLPEGAGKSAMVWLADHLCIFSNAGEGIARQIKHNMRGHGAYLLGASSDHAFWYYFPVLFTIKLAIPLLVAPFALAAIRVRALNNWAGWAALALFAFSFNCRVQIGIRLVLPCLVLAIIGLSSAAIVIFDQLTERWQRTVLKSCLTAAVGWIALGSAGSWPDGLRYINELWGGSEAGYRLVSDSNYDWGQGLPELVDWQRTHAGSALDVWYFGTDPLFQAAALHEAPLHALPIESADDVLSQVAGRRLAVGTTVLYGHGLTTGHRMAAEFLRTCRPVDRTATFLIFDFTSLSPNLARRGLPETHP